MAELKPCPFCGEIGTSLLEGSTYRWAVMACSHCEARAPEVRKERIGPGFCDQDEIDAREEWNRRPSVPPVGERELVDEIVAWQRATFPNKTPESCAAHLLEEARELRAAPADPEEAADVFHLLLGVADSCGYDLFEVTRAKFEKNKLRDWSAPPNAEGYVKALSSPAPDPAASHEPAEPADPERIYPCADCGVMRTKAEGGTTFTVCDECWDKHHGKAAPDPASDPRAIECRSTCSRAGCQNLRPHWCSSCGEVDNWEDHYKFHGYCSDDCRAADEAPPFGAVR